MLPTISTVAIGEASVPTVSARDLHAFLDVRRDFTTWIKDRLDTYGFAQDLDFVTFQAAPQNGGAGNRGVRTEYAISLDTAKELAMVERTDKGREARRYFIACEMKLKAMPAVAVHPVPQSYSEALQAAADLARENERQRAEIAVLAPRSEALAVIADTDGSFCVRDAAKALGLSERVLRDFLRSDGWIYRRDSMSAWIARANRLTQGWMTTKVVPVETGAARPWNRTQARITCQGLVVLAQRLGRPVPPEAQSNLFLPAPARA